MSSISNRGENELADEPSNIVGKSEEEIEKKDQKLKKKKDEILSPESNDDFSK